jgi:predicted nucleotidyltransferase
MKRDEIITFLKEHKRELTKRYQIEKLALFGSFARGENSARSDIDIAIETPMKDYFKLFELKEDLEKSFGLKVDIVRIRERMNEALRRRIEKEAIYV